jgi:hypothetical protein
MLYPTELWAHNPACPVPANRYYTRTPKRLTRHSISPISPREPIPGVARGERPRFALKARHRWWKLVDLYHCQEPL